MYRQVYDYIEKHGILTQCQSGFRKDCSTITVLLKVADDIRNAMDAGKITVLSLLDLSKGP